MAAKMAAGVAAAVAVMAVAAGERASRAGAALGQSGSVQWGQGERRRGQGAGVRREDRRTTGGIDAVRGQGRYARCYVWDSDMLRQMSSPVLAS